MKNIIILTVIAMVVPVSAGIISTDQYQRTQSGWVQLFNGEDLSGWYTYQREPEPTSEVEGIPKDEEGNYLEPIGLNNDPLNVFTVTQEDGQPAIRISGETFGILVTDQEYENYHLRLQFKWGNKKYPPRENLPMDSGILYHSIGEEGSWGGVWMQSLECQVMVGNSGDFIAVDTTSVRIPAQKSGDEFIYNDNSSRQLFDVENAVCNHSEDFEKPVGEWNTMEIYTFDGNSVHVVNGKVNMRTYNSQYLKNGKNYPLKKGKIQLQSEGAEIFYRNIEIKSIDGIPDEIM
ncbi:MAG: DUF1080 domain-containing protein [Balneolaceae bacterium]|nr:DUF1080 domain-containing protein [Balneolaceae bacterium]